MQNAILMNSPKEKKIVSIFNEEIPTISEETKAYAPIVKAEAVKVEPVEDSYEYKLVSLIY